MVKNSTELNNQPVSLTQPPAGYAEWLGELKNRIHNAQQRASLAVNRELVLLTRLKQPEQRLAEKITTSVRAELVEALFESIRKALRQAQGERGNLALTEWKICFQPERRICAQPVRFRPITPERMDHA
ncbi:MAG: hypothetical protein RQ723_03760 [Desulfuromonadales bacterium]|nr:hypothetical protein [Desulfuromonadales bacterium]